MKKIISALMASVILFCAFSVGIDAQSFIEDSTFIIGNVDKSEDGKTNLKDIFVLKKYFMNMTGESEEVDTSAADLSCDGKITLVDLFLMKSYITGFIKAADLENGFQINKLTVGGTDISEFCIVVLGEDEERENAQYTAEILQKYIAVSTGNTLNIVGEMPEDAHAIVINAIDRFSEFGEELQNENYIYEVKDGNLQLYGTYRGNMYAAYEILENYLGFRFFDSEYTFLYKQRCVDIPDGTYVYMVPYLKLRSTVFNFAAFPENYYLPARINEVMDGREPANPRWGTFYGHQRINAHSYDEYWQMGTGTMPDESFGTLYERLVEKFNSGEVKDVATWQPCATAESTYKILFSGFLDTLRRMEAGSTSIYKYQYIVDGEMTDYFKSGQPTFSFSLCDNEKYCTCRNCTKKANGTGNSTKEGYSGLYVDLANRAARDIQEYYPGMRVHTILYNHAIPETVRPDKNLIIYYCGQGCANHTLASGECGTCLGQLGKENNVSVSESLKAWGQFCAESGAEMWFWYYGVTYGYYLVSMPCIFNIYYDIKFLYEECNVKGINFEGYKPFNNFETLKGYLASKMMWDPTMSYEDYIGYMKEYLYMYYGDGYEKIYEFIEMENTAGDLCGTCFVGNFDLPGDMFSYSYIEENYEYMRQLLCDAYDMADRNEYKQRIELLLCCFDFLGLSSSYTSMYTNGDEQSRATYEARFTWMHDYIIDNNIQCGNYSITSMPEEIDFNTNPMLQVYKSFSRRAGVSP